MLSIGPLRTSRVGQRNVIARLTTYIRCTFQRHFRFGIFVCLVFSETHVEMSHSPQCALPWWLSRSCPCLSEESYPYCIDWEAKPSRWQSRSPHVAITLLQIDRRALLHTFLQSAMQSLFMPNTNSLSILYLTGHRGVSQSTSTSGSRLFFV
jgi:hypothetical protein